MGRRAGQPGPRSGYSSRSLDEQANGVEPPVHVPVEPGSYQNAVVILLTDGATTTGPNPVDAGQIAGRLWGAGVYRGLRFGGGRCGGI